MEKKNMWGGGSAKKLKYVYGGWGSAKFSIPPPIRISNGIALMYTFYHEWIGEIHHLVSNVIYCKSSHGKISFLKINGKAIKLMS